MAAAGRLREPVRQGLTRPMAWRLAQLDRLERALMRHATAALEALASDLDKPPVESWFEVATVRQEIALARRQLRRWMAPRPVPMPLSLRPGQAEVIAEPLGCVLIIGPWNYPLSLSLQPLVSALAAGNTAILKPSEHAPATAALIATLISEGFGSDTVLVVTGDGRVAQELLEQPFDHIFFTGGERVGRLVMAAAARHLTPVTLELGGKSPAVVLADADLEVTARRLVWGKSLNAGQTCIAPDHLLVETGVVDDLVARMLARIDACFGPEPLQSPDLATIVNDAQFQRLAQLLEGARRDGRILGGGGIDPARRRIAPTLIRVQDPADPLMQEEIFGPLLPVLAVDDLDAAIGLINRRPRPLALYLFCRRDSARRQILRQTSSGTVAFNDVVLQVMVPDLPFGGVGASGFGSHHGQAGFTTFSHQRSVLRRPFLLDWPVRYPPYRGKLPLVKRLLG